jgi:hypothetical protein
MWGREEREHNNMSSPRARPEWREREEREEKGGGPRPLYESIVPARLAQLDGPTFRHASYGQRRAPPWLSLSRQRMWRDSMVLSRQPRWRDQKGHFCKYFFSGLVLKYLFKRD